MQIALKNMDDEEYRKEGMMKIAEADMNIEEFKVQPATNQCMTDFFTFQNMGIDQVETEVAGDVENGVRPEEVPIDFYDNDDGFWDGYISHKRTRATDAGFLTRRPFFSH